MKIRGAVHRDAKALIGIIMEKQGAHVSRRGTVTQVERMLNAARRRDDYVVRVAEKENRVRGLLSAMYMMRHGLWEDKFVWQVQFLMGMNVLKPLLEDLRHFAGKTPVLMLVGWEDDPRAGSLDAALQRMGFSEFGSVLCSRGLVP